MHSRSLCRTRTSRGADFSTVAYPYIFAGDSFDENYSLPLNFTGLGDVLFDVADDATPGPFTVSFTGSTGVANLNSLSDDAGDAISVDTFSGATGTVASPAPEPGTALLLGGALSILGLLRRKR